MTDAGHGRRVTFDGERWSNADADRIQLADPDARWPAMFAAEKERILAALDPALAPRIEHVGSTAIPGVVAKPIIDILIVLASEEDWPRLIGPLESLEYVYWADNPRSDRMLFVKGMPPYGEARTHHVHVRRPGEARDLLLFRDYVAGNAAVAAEYAGLKAELALRHPTDREAYTRAKDGFIAKVLRNARAWEAGSPEF